MTRIILITVLAFFLLMPVVQKALAQGANAAFQVTGLPLPRFVSLSSNKVYMRTGPGRKYPILWEYQRKGLPVEIVMEFDVWRKIKDPSGDQGWVHQSLLSGKRTAMIAGDDMAAIKKQPENGSRIMAYVEPKAIVSLTACHGGYCQVSSGVYTGWIERKYIWGVYAAEEFN